MATIEAPSTEANVPLHKVEYVEESTKGGFLGGLVEGAVDAFPDVMKVRKAKMKLEAAGDIESKLAAAGMEMEEQITALRSQVQGGMFPRKAKFEANMNLTKVARKYGLPIKETKDFQSLYTEQINDLGYAGESSGNIMFWTGSDGTVHNNMADPAVQKNVEVATLSRLAPATFSMIQNNPDLQAEVLGIASAAEIGGYQDSINKQRLSQLNLSKQQKEDDAKKFINVRAKEVYGQILALTKVQMSAVKNSGVAAPAAKAALAQDIREHIQQSIDPSILATAGMTVNDYMNQFGNTDELLNVVENASNLKNLSYAESVVSTGLALEGAKSLAAAPAKDRLNLYMGPKLQALTMANFYAKSMGMSGDFTVSEPGILLERAANIERHGKRVARDRAAFESSTDEGGYAFEVAFGGVLEDLEVMNFAIKRDERGFAISGMDIPASLDAAKAMINSKAYKNYVGSNPDFVRQHQLILQSVQNIEDSILQLN